MSNTVKVLPGNPVIAFPKRLLADPERKVIEAYDVWKEKKNYGKVSITYCPSVSFFVRSEVRFSRPASFAY